MTTHRQLDKKHEVRQALLQHLVILHTRECSFSTTRLLMSHAYTCVNEISKQPVRHLFSSKLRKLFSPTVASFSPRGCTTASIPTY